jgi:hypothetical protein
MTAGIRNISLTGVVGKKPSEVVNSLCGYAHSAGGGLEQEALPGDHDNSCVIEESTGNTTIFYSDAFLEADESAVFISKNLNAPVFSFHIHDGDFWMYTLFVNGEPVDQFNPIPDYFEDALPAEEIDKFKGNVKTIAKFVPGIDTKNIEKYLVRWDLDKENAKAYPDDEFTNKDWNWLIL